MTAPSNPSIFWSPWSVLPLDFPSQISIVNAGHAPPDDTVPSGGKSTVPISNSSSFAPPAMTKGQMEITPSSPSGPRICTVEGCDRPHTARGYCKAHWHRWNRYGGPLAGPSLVGTNRTPAGEVQKYLRDVVLPYEGTECLEWPYHKDADGYPRANYGGKRVCRITRIICEHENGPPPTPDHEAAHSCGKGHLGCVAKKHLSWKTHTENMADKLIHGTSARGERCGTSKLTSTQVQEIRSLKGTASNCEIGARFGVSEAAVCHIYAKTTWAWLEDRA